MVEDHYISISAPSEGEYKDRGSKFIAYALPLNDEFHLSELLQEVKNQHPKARHYCFAYRLGVDMYNFRTNDDGEPSGTAGKPILAAIDSHKLSDILVIVVRYFGGTKLGVSGLINAYRSATNNSLSDATTKDVYLTRKCKVHFDYSHMGKIMDVIKHQNLQIIDKTFTDQPSVEIEIRESAFDHTISKIKASLLGWNIEDINDDTSVPYCTFEL